MAKSGEVHPLGEAFKKLFEHSAKQAGWLPLFVCVAYAVSRNVRLPAQVSFGGLSVRLFQLPDEWAIPLATLFFFLLGDALDKAVFKRETPDRRTHYRWPGKYFEQERSEARKDLQLGAGSYSAALGVIAAADVGIVPVTLTNELAKFLRSLVLPALIVAGYRTWPLGGPFYAVVIGTTFSIAFLWLPIAPSRRSPQFLVLMIAAAGFATCAAMLFAKQAWAPLAFLVISFASLFGYLTLKNWHILLVYKTATKVIEAESRTDKYVVGTLLQGAREVRLVFWDGKFVGSAFAPKH